MNNIILYYSYKLLQIYYTTTTVTEKDTTGAETKKTETTNSPDGSTTEKVTEKKSDGSETEKVTEKKSDGSETETVTEKDTKKDVIRTTVTERNSDGEEIKVSETIINPDGTTTATEVIFKNSSEDGEKVAKTSVTTAKSSNLEAYAKTLVEEGQDIKVEMYITPKQENEVEKASAQAIRNTVDQIYAGIDNEMIEVEHLEIDLKKYLENAEKGVQITDAGVPIEIELSVDTTKMGSPKVIRIHDGVAKVFERLDTKPAGSNTNKDATYYVEAGNLYLYSQYFSDFAIVYVTEKAYEVTIENGVDNTFKRVVTEGNKVTPTISTTKEGYEFAGWYTDPAFTKEWKVDHDTVTSDVTLYAKWVKKEAPVTPTSAAEASTEAAKSSPTTGDENAVSAVIMLMLLALMAECILLGKKYKLL